MATQSAWAQVNPTDLEAQTFVDHWNEGGVSGDFTLPYRIFKPDGYSGSAAGSLPLVLYLHGSGERGTDNISQLNWGQPMGFVQSAVQSSFPSFFVAPQAPVSIDPSDPRYYADGEYWVNNYISDPDEYRLANVPASRSLLSVYDLVDDLKAQFPQIDPNRVYITGWSSGGDAVWYAMLTRPDLFAAGIPIAGLGDPTAVAGAHLQERGIWAWQGDNGSGSDGLVPASATEKMVDAIIAAGGTLGYDSEALLRESIVTTPGISHFNIMDAAFGSGVYDANLATNPTYAWLFNQSLPQQEGPGVTPEPGALWLLALGAPLLLRHRRRRER